MDNYENKKFKMSIGVEFQLARAVQHECIVVFRELAKVVLASPVDVKRVSYEDLGKAIKNLRTNIESKEDEEEEEEKDGEEEEDEEPENKNHNQKKGKNKEMDDDIDKILGHKNKMRRENVPRFMKKRYMVALTKMMNERNQHYISIPSVSSADGRLFNKIMCLYMDIHLRSLIKRSRIFCNENKVRKFRVCPP